MSQANMSQANVALVQNMYAAFGRGDMPTLLGAMTPDIDWRVNGRREHHRGFGAWKGREQVGEFFKVVAEDEEFSAFTPKEFHISGDKVFVLGHYTGTVRSSGRKFDSDWLHVFTVTGGKVSAFHEFTDTAQFAIG